MKTLAFLILMSYASLGIAQSTGTFTATGDMNFTRSFHTATLLSNGKVLIVGGAGVTRSGDQKPVTSAELYDAVTGTFILTGNMNTPRIGPTATLLNDGRVLIVGGSGCVPNSAELYDPVTGTFSNTGGSVTGQIGGWAI